MMSSCLPQSLIEPRWDGYMAVWLLGLCIPAYVATMRTPGPRGWDCLENSSLRKWKETNKHVCVMSLKGFWCIVSKSQGDCSDDFSLKIQQETGGQKYWIFSSLVVVTAVRSAGGCVAESCNSFWAIIYLLGSVNLLLDYYPVALPQVITKMLFPPSRMLAGIANLFFFLAVSRTMPWYVWQRHCIGCKMGLWRHPFRLVPPAPCS
jgi:hypothetical protein